MEILSDVDKLTFLLSLYIGSSYTADIQKIKYRSIISADRYIVWSLNCCYSSNAMVASR